MKIYALKDVKSSEFINIFLQKNDNMAIRYVQQLILNPQNGLISSCAEDFELYCLGDMLMETGFITPQVEFIKNLMELKQ